MDWGQVATGRLRGGLVGPSHSPARSAPRREAPTSTIRGACQGGPLVGLDPDVPRAQQPVHGCSHGDAATAVGAPWWSARGHGHGSRPGWTTRGRKGLQGLVLPFAGRLRPTASVVFGDCSRSEAAPTVDARWWPIRAPSCPGVQADDHRIQAARAGAVPLHTKRGVNEPARSRGRPPVSKGPTSEVDGLGHGPVPRVGTRRRSRLAPPESQMIGQLSGQPAFQGHSSSKSGSRPSVPVITGPARIDPLEQAAQRPTGTQPLHHTRTRQHEPSHHQSSRIDPFKSRGYTDN